MNSVISTVGGYTLVLAAAVALFVAPCGPGCDWPAHLATTVYSLGILILRNNDRVARRTGYILLAISIMFLSLGLYNRAQFEEKMLDRMQELRRETLESQSDPIEYTEAGENASRPTP